MQPLVVGVLAFAAIFLIEAVASTLRYFKERSGDELKRRLQSLGTGEQGSVGLLRKGRMSASPAWDLFLHSIPVAERLEALLEQAEINITVARLLVYCAVAAAAGATFGAVAGGAVLALVLVPVGGFLPIVFVRMVRERRNKKLSEQLPDALDMMARSLRAGHALSSSFRMVASELPQPISVEFARAFEEQELGLPFERAVAQMTKRAPNNRDLKIFAVSVIVQKETGGNLVEIIEKIAETIRSRYKFFGKLNTLTAEGRMSSYVLGALPILTGLFMGFMNPPYIALLFSTDLGHKMLGFAIVSWVMGFFWMRQMSKVTL